MPHHVLPHIGQAGVADVAEGLVGSIQVGDIEWDEGHVCPYLEEVVGRTRECRIQAHPVQRIEIDRCAHRQAARYGHAHKDRRNEPPVGAQSSNDELYQLVSIMACSPRWGSSAAGRPSNCKFLRSIVIRILPPEPSLTQTLRLTLEPCRSYGMVTRYPSATGAYCFVYAYADRSMPVSS